MNPDYLLWSCHLNKLWALEQLNPFKKCHYRTRKDDPCLHINCSGNFPSQEHRNFLLKMRYVSDA